MNRNSAIRAGTTVLLAIGTHLLFGCVAARPAPSQMQWRPNKAIHAAVTPFWHQHPIDAVGQAGLGAIPDRMLKQGEPIRHIGGRFGYARIQLSDLSTGWILAGMMTPVR